MSCPTLAPNNGNIPIPTLRQNTPAQSPWTNGQSLPWMECSRADPADNNNRGMIVQCLNEECRWLGYEMFLRGTVLSGTDDYLCPRCRGHVVYLLLSEAQKRLLSPELP
jgi:hypothetical protein